MKPAFVTIIFIISIELLSILCFFYPIFSIPALALIFLSVLIFFIKKPECGVYVVGTELVIGSLGRLIAYSVSLRMVLFSALMTAWIIDEIRHRKIYEKLSVPIPIILLLAVVVLQSIHGSLAHYSLSAIISDANNYFFFLIAFPLIRYHTKINKDIVLNIFFVAVGWLALKTLIIFTIFTHLSQPFFNSWMYHWIRDTRIGEITGYGQGLVRVFLQSHIFAAVAFILLLSEQFYTGLKKYFLLILSFSTLLLSLSRSIWIGTTFGIGTVLVYALRRKKETWQNIKIILCTIVGAFILITSVYYLPVGTRTEVPLYRLFTIRGENLGTETAALSRWEQLPLLWNAIKKKPILGYGFGSSLQIGTVSKSAFEWGWLDMWFKMGILGVALYGWMIYTILKNAVAHNFVLPILAVLITTHIFTPYLNHPLGIGILLGLLLVCARVRCNMNIHET